MLAVLPGGVLNGDWCLFPRGATGSPSRPSDPLRARLEAGDALGLGGERWRQRQESASRGPADPMRVRREMARGCAAQWPSSGLPPWSSGMQNEGKCSSPPTGGRRAGTVQGNGSQAAMRAAAPARQPVRESTGLPSFQPVLVWGAAPRADAIAAPWAVPPWPRGEAGKCTDHGGQDFSAAGGGEASC